MYPLHPTAVFAHQRVLDQPLALARMQRMCGALGIAERDVRVVGYDDIDQIVEAAGAHDLIATDDILQGGHGRVRQGHDRHFIAPVLVFSTFVWDHDQPPPRSFRHPRARDLSHLLWGVGARWAFSHRELFMGVAPGGYVCQGGWGIHSADGCVHKCDYCGLGQLVTLQCNLESLADEFDRVFELRPQQKLYRYDLHSDIPCFEPEYDACRVLAERCQRSGDKYLLIYTKSNNVDWLMDHPQREHLPCYWTLATDSVAGRIERNTPSLDERLEAMRKCADNGYTVRAGFTPIIPVRGWREEATAMLERLFSVCRPDVVRVWVLSMMDAREFRTLFDLDEMDPKFVRRIAEDEERMNGTHKAPFPLDVRAEVYDWYIEEVRRISPATPVALCTEDPEMWDLLGHKLLMSEDRMFCCCGGTSVPGSYVPL
ncbi:MAG: hypothetical protein HYU66_17085 [Armatimonadetes bacterium]|nr:hypothetical protein [Armatimonadota bacterium]